MQTYVEHGGTKYQQFRAINDEVFAQFMDSIDRGISVHDRDLEEWALLEAQSRSIHSFKASSHWLENFKARNKIVSRKVNRIRGQKKRNDAAKLTKEIKAFFDCLGPILQATPRNKVFNTDQAGINLEIASNRTLQIQGVKRVEVVAQAISATTHSISIQPVISAAGELLSPLLVCFYEPGKVSDAKFKADLQEFTNLRCVKSTSGKFGSIHQEMWLRESFLPSAGENAVLIIDKWTGYNSAIELNEVKRSSLGVHRIPAGATGLIQVLDVNYNRQFKHFLRIVEEKILRHCPDFKISKRKNIAALISLIHKQFGAPRFRHYLQYGWYKAGYYQERPPAYETPVQYCLQNYQIGSKCECKKICFVRCAYCEKCLCFEHFVNTPHYCVVGTSKENE